MVDRAAYAVCLRLAHQHYENFPVASRLLPPASRPHIAAIYAFARVADDFADEGDRAPDERLALLDAWSARLAALSDGRSAPTGLQSDDAEHALIFRALGETIQTCRLDVQLLENLLSAFRQDVTTARYETWEDLLDYCRRSANPIGRLVLRVSGHRDERLDTPADAICTALQLTNFWQDLERDWSRGRLYVPGALLRASGAEPDALNSRTLSPAWRQVLEDVGRRTRGLFFDGQPLLGMVRGRLGWELRATWHGGMRILQQLEAGGFDVFRRRPALTWRDAVPILFKTLRSV